MKSRSSKNHGNGNGHITPHALVAKAAATKKLAKAARKHLKMLKAEHKQARKAFKQAREAARIARKEAKAALKNLRTRNGTGKAHPARHRKAAAPKATAKLRAVSHSAHGLLPAAPRTPDLSGV